MTPLSRWRTPDVPKLRPGFLFQALGELQLFRSGRMPADGDAEKHLLLQAEASEPGEDEGGSFPQELASQHHVDSPFHLVYFNPESFRKFFESSGFTVVRDHSREMTDLWLLCEPSVGNRATQARVQALGNLVRDEKKLGKEEKFRKYYPAFRVLMLQAMGWAVTQFVDKIESALDCMNCLCLVVRKNISHTRSVRRVSFFPSIVNATAESFFKSRRTSQYET